MIEQTGADGVMVARGAQGYPWIFREAHSLLRDGVESPRPTPLERIDMAREHAERACRVRRRARCPADAQARSLVPRRHARGLACPLANQCVPYSRRVGCAACRVPGVRRGARSCLSGRSGARDSPGPSRAMSGAENTAADLRLPATVAPLHPRSFLCFEMRVLRLLERGGRGRDHGADRLSRVARSCFSGSEAVWTVCSNRSTSVAGRRHWSLAKWSICSASSPRSSSCMPVPR